ncbi:MAG: DUF1428 domain-containing protein [Candidatus Sumerlaeaceae bacterium]|nr:DUF1428 domain-containing protein [Candidatus Sumerlaeaceae bacterium]
MAYYDFAVIPVRTSNLAAYRKMVKQGAAAWKRCGALEYVEAIGDGLTPGKRTSFPRSVKAKPDETVGVALLKFKNKAARNKAWKLIMKDPFMNQFDGKTMPFDGKRMFFGGFKPIGGF